MVGVIVGGGTAAIVTVVVRDVIAIRASNDVDDDKEAE